jgi:hypothetical protein
MIRQRSTTPASQATRRGCIPASRGRRLEYATLAYNVTGVVILAVAAITVRSVALAGFGCRFGEPARTEVS